MPSHKVLSRRFTTVPDKPLSRRTSWPPSTVPPKPKYEPPFEADREDWTRRFEYHIWHQVPANDPGYEADIEDHCICCL